MGKNHRHKKHLKSEKAKVKLRLKGEKTKFLPKGANVTNTTFKIKPIVVQEQLKSKDDTEPLSRRKLNVGELLTRLKHYNATIRKDSCIELRQVIATYPDEVLQKSLSQLLHSVSPLISDKESVVRKEAVKLLDTILKYTNVENLRPFFNILSSYVRCAMTNIDVGVQEDSLAFLDTIVKYAPSLLAENSDKILPIFISMLSKLQSAPKTLNIHMSQKLTSINWTIKVLVRLSKLLEAVVANSQRERKDTISFDNVYDAEKTSRVPIFANYCYTKKCPINFFQNATIDRQEAHYDDLNKYIQVLVPFLYETWLEVAPEAETSGQSGTTITQDCAAVLRCVTKIMHLLLAYTKLNAKTANMYNTKDIEKFLSCLLKQFPYSSQEQSMRKAERKLRKEIDANNDHQCIEENLLICYIFTILNIDLRNKHQSDCAKSVVSYLNRCLVHRNYISDSNIKLLLQTLKHVFNNCDNWKKRGVPISQLIEDIIVHFYSNSSLSRAYKDETFKLLCSILQQPSLNCIVNYQVWLSTLPSLLCNKKISERIVDMLSLIARQNNGMFHQALIKRVPNILDNLQHITITETENKRMAFLKIVSVFYYTPILYRENLECFANFLDKNQDSDLFDIVKNMLKLRFELDGTEKNSEIFEKYCWWN